MHTLSLFPAFFSYEALGPAIIRIVLGITLAHFGYRKVIGQGDSSGSNSRTYGWVEIAIALLLVIGLWTQAAAALNVLILIIKLAFKARDKKFLSDGVNYYIILLAMAVSLLFTGPGAFAIDYPL